MILCSQWKTLIPQRNFLFCVVCADLFPSSENNRTGLTGAATVCDLFVHGLELLHEGFKAMKGEDKCIVSFIVAAVSQVSN